MKTSKNIESHTNEYGVGFCDDEGNWVDLDDDNRERVAKKFNCNPELLEFIEQNIRGLAETVHLDLCEIWRKIEENK